MYLKCGILYVSCTSFLARFGAAKVFRLLSSFFGLWAKLFSICGLLVTLALSKNLEKKMLKGLSEMSENRFL